MANPLQWVITMGEFLLAVQGPQTMHEMQTVEHGRRLLAPCGWAHVGKWDYALLLVSLYSQWGGGGAGHASGADTQLLPRQLSQIIVGLCSHRLYTFDFSTLHNWQVFVNWSTATVLSVMLLGNLCSCTAVMVERHQLTAAVTSYTYQYSHGMSISSSSSFLSSVRIPLPVFKQF